VSPREPLTSSQTLPPASPAQSACGRGCAGLHRVAMLFCQTSRARAPQLVEGVTRLLQVPVADRSARAVISDTARAPRAQIAAQKVAHRYVPYCTTTCAVVHIVHRLTRVKRVALSMQTQRAVMVDRGSRPRRTLPGWNRRWVCPGSQSEPSCLVGSANEWDAASMCTSPQRSTAASGVARSIPRVTSVCATRHAVHQRDRSQCCASCGSTFRSRGSILRRN
jgi:hypothetical protein